MAAALGGIVAGVSSPSHPALARVFALQRSAGNAAVLALLRRGAADAGPAPTPAPRPPVARPAAAAVARVDQRVGTGELSAGQLTSIQNEIFPAAAPAVGSSAPRLWDGRRGAVGFFTQRMVLRVRLLRAMNDYLDNVMASIRVEADPARTPRVPIATMAGAGQAAKRQVDGVFGRYASAAALTAPQAHLHSTFTMTPGRQLIDRSDPRQFRTNVDDLGDWIAQTAPDAQSAAEDHAFVKDRSAEEATWLRDHVIGPFVAARRADLDLYDRFGFFDTTRRRISVVPGLTAGGSQAPGAGGAPSDALRHQQWVNWQLLTHEYVHTLEHPSFQQARGGNRVLFEGFCEHFAMQVKRHWVPIARADSDPALRREIEGADPGGGLWPGFQPTWIDPPDPGAYAAYVTHTENIRNHIGPGGEEALRGAFFQGHVELIGLQASGAMQGAPVHLNDDVHAPDGIRDRRALAAAANVPEVEIARDNPGLSASTSRVTPGMALRLVGCREHVVVQARPTPDAPTGRAVVETPAQIAAQHGVSEAQVRAANPRVDWIRLRPGTHLLIPRH